MSRRIGAMPPPPQPPQPPPPPPPPPPPEVRGAPADDDASFNAFFARALSLGVIDEARLDRLTDDLASGELSQSEAVERWRPIVERHIVRHGGPKSAQPASPSRAEAAAPSAAAPLPKKSFELLPVSEKRAFLRNIVARTLADDGEDDEDSSGGEGGDPLHAWCRKLRKKQARIRAELCDEFGEDGEDYHEENYDEGDHDEGEAGLAGVGVPLLS